jgi:hypothetical protein
MADQAGVGALFSLVATGCQIFLQWIDVGWSAEADVGELVPVFANVGFRGLG